MPVEIAPSEGRDHPRFFWTSGVGKSVWFRRKNRFHNVAGPLQLLSHDLGVVGGQSGHPVALQDTSAVGQQTGSQRGCCNQNVDQVCGAVEPRSWHCKNPWYPVVVVALVVVVVDSSTPAEEPQAVTRDACTRTNGRAVFGGD